MAAINFCYQTKIKKSQISNWLSWKNDDWKRVTSQSAWDKELYVEFEDEDDSAPIKTQHLEVSNLEGLYSPSRSSTSSKSSHAPTHSTCRHTPNQNHIHIPRYTT